MTSQETADLILGAGRPWLYHACVAAAGLAGGLLLRRDSRAWPLNPREKALVIFCVLTGALAGSALPAFFAGDLVQWQAEHFWIGPKTIMGGLIFGFFSVALFKRRAGISFDTSDGFARGAALLMAVGRLGCVAGHCCFGRPAPWGVDLGDGAPRFPVQALEAGLLFLLFGFLHDWHRRGAFRRRRLFLLFLIYGGMRFFLEFAREPIARDMAGLGYYQWVALLLAATGAFQIYKRSPRRAAAYTGAAGLERGAAGG
jgi:prolipoprotein diacylglyceryltransferase